MKINSLTFNYVGLVIAFKLVGFNAVLKTVVCMKDVLKGFNKPWKDMSSFQALQYI